MAEVTVVVEFLANVVPTWVPAPPLHLLAAQATVQTHRVNVGEPVVGLDTVTL